MKRQFGNKAKAMMLTAACGLALGPGAQAAMLAFEHGDPGKFLDVRATQESQTKFEQTVMSELEEQFREEAAALPDNQTLKVTVTDVDLAGDIEYFHRWYPFGLRVIRNVDVPRLEFSYELRDANGEVIKAGEENIRDLNFRGQVLVQRNLEPLDYEREMISEWYAKTFR